MIRRVLAAAALAAAALAVVPTTAQAGTQGYNCRPNYRCLTTYYSDAAHTDVVGEKGEGCDGSSEIWGDVTRYKTLDVSYCG